MRCKVCYCEREAKHYFGSFAGLPLAYCKYHKEVGERFIHYYALAINFSEKVIRIRIKRKEYCRNKKERAMEELLE